MTDTMAPEAVTDLAYQAREALVQWALEDPNGEVHGTELAVFRAVGALLEALGVRKPRSTGDGAEAM